MLKKLMKSSDALNVAEMKNVMGGISVGMATCQTGAWGCWNTSFCMSKCGFSYCCNECPSYITCNLA